MTGVLPLRAVEPPAVPGLRVVPEGGLPLLVVVPAGTVAGGTGLVVVLADEGVLQVGEGRLGGEVVATFRDGETRLLAGAVFLFEAALSKSVIGIYRV